MALDIKIQETAYEGTTHTVSITDTTGVYNLNSNVGGYGVPNSDRSVLALILSVRKPDGTNEFAVYDDVLVDTTYQYAFTSDGAYELNLCAIDYEAGAYNPLIMTLGRVFYSALDSLIYKVVDSNGVNVVEETTDIFANNNEVSTPLFYLVKSYTETRLIDIFCASCDCGGLKEEYFHLKMTLDAIECNFNKEQYTEVDNLFNFANKIVI